ncbi:hypothetical protein EV363DRAFT_1324135 [Boletus edulis]|nr:hypothetical protein EV363DRAFT_1324135 [Boletus edulis]
MEITPVVDRNRGQRRAPRRSLSDEEAEKPKAGRRADPSFRLSTALTFDALRARLASSRSQLMGQNPPEALYDPSITASESQAHPKTSNSTRVDPQVNSLTPYPSFQMSAQLASQSNLLEQDSEMQRAMGDVLNSENEASTSAPNVAQTNPAPSDSLPSSSLRGSKNDSKLEPRRSSYEFDPSTTSSAVNEAVDRVHPSQQEERTHQRERVWNRPRLPSGSSTPEMHHRHSQESHRRLSQEFRSSSHSKSFSHEPVMSQSSAAQPVHRRVERRSSLASLRSFDDDHSSRHSSIGSQADYRERVSELDRERNYEREREWNKRHSPSRPSSSLSTNSNHSFTHSHSHPPRSPSAIPYLTPTHASLQRKSSRTSLRSDSPASLASSCDSLKEREEEEKEETIHKRERNWNSPRPHWLSSKSPSAPLHKTRHNSLRASSSLTHLGDSNRHEDVSRVSSKPQSVLPKVDSLSATSPALLHKSGDRSHSGLEKGAVSNNQLVQSKNPSPGKSPGAVSKFGFGWNFDRSPLPPLELDDSAGHRKNTSSPVVASHIPVRSRMKGFSSVVHAASDMSLTNIVGDESISGQDYQNTVGEVVEPYSHREPPAAKNSWSQEDMVLGNDEESIGDVPPQSTTPKSRPPNLILEEVQADTDTEVLTSPVPQGSPLLGTSASNEASLQKLNDPPRVRTPDSSSQEPLVSATPPGTPPSASPGSRFPPSETSFSLALVTPPRQTSFSSSISAFPSSPHDLPDLPGPPSSDDDVLGGTPTKDRRVVTSSNFTLTKTPKPPGAWAATPLPPKFDRRSPSPADFFPLESTPPAFTSTPLPRANSYPHTRTDTATDDPSEDGLLTPVGTLSRARSLPLRTPAPPGAWVATPGQSALLSNGAEQSQYGSIGRRKGLLKVRFDVAESETSATEGHPNSPLTAIRLTNPDDAEVVVNGVPQSTQTSTAPHRPVTPDQPTTPTSRESGSSPRSLRKSPSVRLVDAYGRKRVDEEGIAKPLIALPNGHADAERKAPPTPRHSLLRVVDAMANRSFETDVSVISDDTPIGHAEALARMRKTLRDLAESLSETDRSEDLELNSGHLEQLEEVSKAARFARNQLAENLQLETAKQHDLQHTSKFSAWTRGILPVTTKKSWSTTIIYCGVIIQLLLVLAMWRYAHVEARHLFYTTYYDPLYPEFTPLQENSCFSGTISTSRSWTMVDSYEIIRREGWRSVRKEILRAMRHIGDQAWELWGENAHFEKPT